MTQQSSGGFGSVFTWGLIAGAAYFVYETFFAPASATPAPTAGSVTLDNLSSALQSTAPPVAAASTSPAGGATGGRRSRGPKPDLAKQLEAAAAHDPAFQNNRMTAWQWNYYNASIQPVSDSAFGNAFYSTAADPITAEQYVATLQRANGFSGLGSVSAAAPMLFQTANGRRVVVWAAPGGDGTVKLFPAASPFLIRRRGLPA